MPDKGMRWLRTAVLGLSIAVLGCAGTYDPDVGLDADRFGVWDVNDDDLVERSEFGANWDDAFGTWDEDDSGFIEQDEFDAGVGDADDEFGAWSDWDADRDGLLDDDEFIEGSFSVFDDNDNDLIDTTEWGNGIGLW